MCTCGQQSGVNGCWLKWNSGIISSAMLRSFIRTAEIPTSFIGFGETFHLSLIVFLFLARFLATWVSCFRSGIMENPLHPPAVTTVGWICTSFITSPVRSKKIEHSKRLTLTVISSFPLTWWEKRSCLMWSKYYNNNNNNNNNNNKNKNKKTRTRKQEQEKTMPRTAKAIACYKAFCIFTTRFQIEQIKPHQCNLSQRMMYPITLRLWSLTQLEKQRVPGTWYQ